LPYNWNGTNYNAAGSYTFTTINSAGCDSLAISNLTITFPTSSTTTIIICSNELPYLWNGQSITVGGTHTVTLVNHNGCDSISTLQLTVNQTPPKPQVISNQTICQNAVSQPLTATGSYPLLWYTSPTGGVSSSIPPVPSTNIPGIYHFYVSQINGNCESPRNEIIIRIVRKPVLGNDVEQHICFGTNFNLNSVYNTGNQNIVWTFNNTVVANPSSINTSGNYQLVLTNSFGCYDTAIVNLIVQPKLTANAGPDDIAIYNEPYQLHGAGFNHYLWSPASVLNNPTTANPIAVLTDDTQFVLTISDDYGCSDKDTVFIRVLRGPSIYIPNAFTPNGDGLNDNFKPTYVGIQRLDYFRVFDRYGVLVFETNNMGKAWDGLYKSMKQNAGNFVYIVKGIDKYGKEKVLKGNVLLIR
jgi:gliding motility-associated-like protein